MENSINPFTLLERKLDNIESMLMNIKAGDNRQNAPIYLAAPKAADFISKTPNALRVMVFKNQIPFIKKNGKLFFKQSDLIDWLESGRVEADTAVPEDILLKNKKNR